MGQKISIAICILFFEKAGQTIECVESFAPSGVPIYVLNNNSSKESTQKLKDYCVDFPQVKIFDSPENLGVSGGRNFLIKNTHEEWLFFVDNDITIKTADWLEKITQHIQENQKADAFIPKLYNTVEKNYAQFGSFAIKNRLIIKEEGDGGQEINMFPGGASIINRSVFTRLGLYEESMFIGFEDFELAVRGIVSEKPIKAKKSEDIELVHDHRVATNESDKKSAKVRYDGKKLKASHDFMTQKYGIHMDSSWKYWVKNKLNYFTEGKDAKPLSIVERISIRIRNMMGR